MSADPGYFDRDYFRLHPGKRRYLDYLVDLVRRLRPPGPRVLDVGCGYGFFLAALGRAGFAATGLDLSPHAAARSGAESGRPTVAASAEAPLPFADGAFDAVTMLDVVEHLHAYPRALAECARVLAPGGRLAVLTLNRRSLARPLLGRAWSWYQDPTHVHLFSGPELAGELRAAGLHRVETTTLFNFCSVGETTPRLAPLRRIGRVVHLPAGGDSVLVTGER